MRIPIEAVFFDAAGTLITLREPVGATYSRIAAGHQVRASPEALATAFRSAWKSRPQPQHGGQRPADDDRSWWLALVADCFRTATGAALPPPVLDPLFSSLYEHYARPDAWLLCPDALPALRRLHGRFRLFVLSNFDRRLLSILEGHRLSPWFERIILSSETGFSKPHPGIFAAACALAALPPSRCLHAGDDPTADIAGATASGFHHFHIVRPHQDLLSLADELAPRA